MASAEAARDRLCNPSAEVSAHYLIAGTGEVLQLVQEDARAWHAGAGAWHEVDDINSRSIGIELDNRGTHPFGAPQMAALEALLHGILQRWSIPPTGVIAHSDMAPGRKIDPGPRFDWARLARQGLAGTSGQGPVPKTVTPKAFRAAAHGAGYTAQASDADLLQAVRLRHRPWATGPLEPADLAALPPADEPQPVFQMVQKALPEA